MLTASTAARESPPPAVAASTAASTTMVAFWLRFEKLLLRVDSKWCTPTFAFTCGQHVVHSRIASGRVARVDTQRNSSVGISVLDKHVTHMPTVQHMNALEKVAFSSTCLEFRTARIAHVLVCFHVLRSSHVIDEETYNQPPQEGYHGIHLHQPRVEVRRR